MICTNAAITRFMGGILVGAICFFQLSAQPLLYSLQAQLAVTTSVLTAEAHPFSVAANPAAAAGLRKRSWAFGGEQRFLAPGWITSTAAIVFPVARGSWGFLVAHEGLPAMADQLLLVTHAKSVSNQASLGLSLGVNRKKTDSQAPILAPVASAGIMFSVSEELHSGFSYTRTVWQRNSTAAASDLSMLRCMLGYRPTEKFVLMAAVSKESGRAAIASAALCYRPTRKAGFRVGFSGSPSLYWFGLMLGIGKKVAVEVYSGMYSLVGVSNGMNVSGVPTEKRAASANH